MRLFLSLLALCCAAASFAQPQIYGFQPSSAKIGETIKIVGTGFNQVSAVKFWRGRNASFTITNNGTITTKVPKGAFTGTVSLVYPAGTYSSHNNFTVTDGFVPPPPVDPPAGAMTGHPRLFLTPTDVATYRSWALPGNPVWQALKTIAARAKKNEADGFLATDEGNGNTNYVPYPTEEYAELYAFMSLVHPDPVERGKYAQRAHDLMMKMIDGAALGLAQDSDPWRGPKFATYNRSRWYGESFALITDWCYDTFSATEKAKIRKVFLRWIQENLAANVTNFEHPKPLGIVNSPLLTDNRSDVRWSSNNYSCNHARQVGMLSMALDEADDVPQTTSDPAAGTLRRFIGNAIGAWLYVLKENEETEIKGGISPEGIGYGESDHSGIAMLLLSMQTAGTDNPGVYGAAADLAISPYWTQEVLDGYIHSASPALLTLENWIGPGHLFSDFGDVQEYKSHFFSRVLAPVALMAKRRGDTATYAKARWMIDEYEPGHGTTRVYQLSGMLNNYGALHTILYFMTCDPNEAKQPDPRPTMPLDYFGSGLNRILSRTGWGSTASWFTYKCSWNETDHNHNDANQIELYRKGEWLTKGRTGYGANIGASDFQNTLAIENPGIAGNWIRDAEMAHGSQYAYNPAADVKTLHSFGNGYVYAQGNATELYNCASINAVDVAHASRSVLWIKPNVVVVYDRASTLTAQRYKKLFWQTPTVATINGTLGTMTTAGGQKLFVRSVLPLGSSLTAQDVPTSNSGPEAGETATYEPMTARILIEDLTRPKNVRYLTVLQGADGGTNPAITSVIQSDSGALMDGTRVGINAIVFSRNITPVTTTSSFVVPSTTTKTYITGLKPGAGYTVTTTTEASGVRMTLTGGGSLIADAGGVIVV